MKRIRDEGGRGEKKRKGANEGKRLGGAHKAESPKGSRSTDQDDRRFAQKLRSNYDVPDSSGGPTARQRPTAGDCGRAAASHGAFLALMERSASRTAEVECRHGQVPHVRTLRYANRQHVTTEDERATCGRNASCKRGEAGMKTASERRRSRRAGRAVSSGSRSRASCGRSQDALGVRRPLPGR